MYKSNTLITYKLKVNGVKSKSLANVLIYVNNYQVKLNINYQIRHKFVLIRAAASKTNIRLPFFSQEFRNIRNE